MSVIFKVRVLENWHNVLEYETKEIRALYDEAADEIITQTSDEAWDIEYGSRGSEYIPFIFGNPSPIVWSFKPLIRQNALSNHQWNSLLRDCSA